MVKVVDMEPVYSRYRRKRKPPIIAIFYFARLAILFGNHFAVTAPCMMTDNKRNLFTLVPLTVVFIYCAVIVSPSFLYRNAFLFLSWHFGQLIFLCWISLGILFLFLQSAFRTFFPERPPLRAYLELLRPNSRNLFRLLAGLTPPITLTALLAAYSTYKQLILPASDYWAGPMIAIFERTILMGHDPWQITHGLLSIEATYVLDRAYQIWFVAFIGSALICSYLPADPVQRARFLWCYIATWIMNGTVLAYLFPAAGPVFFGDFQHLPDMFVNLKQSLLAQDAALQERYGLNIISLKTQTLLLHNVKTDQIFAGGGISAMPSMHNGMTALLACAGFSMHRWLGWLFTTFAVMIYVGSIHLGWHYALDGIVASAVSILIWKESGVLIARYERRRGSKRRPRLAGKWPPPDYSALRGSASSPQH